MALAANQAQNLPAQNMGVQESLLAPLAALGGQSTGQSTSQTQTPLWQQLAGLGIAGASMFSDARVKENIAHIGALFDAALSIRSIMCGTKPRA